MPSNEVIGFIGLGVMGGPMCGHIARKGDNRVIGHDVVMSTVEAWSDDGVEPVAWSLLVFERILEIII